jgi:DNA-binding response OmpR family regulator
MVSMAAMDTVLIIERDASTRKKIAVGLRQAGFRTRSAVDCDAAAEMLARGGFAAVVCERAVPDAGPVIGNARSSIS